MNTDEFLQYIHPLILDLQPAKVFINIDTNDMTEETYGNHWFPHMTANIRQILEQILAILPNTKIYLIAFYPSNLHLPWQIRVSIQWMKLRTPENLDRSNKTLEEISKTYVCPSLIVMLIRSMIEKSRKQSIPMTAFTYMPMLT